MGKRANGEGSIRYLEDKKLWQGRITVEGKRKTVYGKTRAEVVRKMADTIADPVVEPSKMTVEEWANEWLDSYASIRVRASTLDRYRATLRLYILPFIGDRLVGTVNPVMAQRIQTDMARRVSPSTANLTLVVAKAIFAQAVKLKMATQNPFAEVRRLKNETEPKPVLAVEECRRLLAVGHRLAPLVAVGVYTGMRFGEITALRWADVDLEKKTISVTKTNSKTKVGTVVNDTKTRAGRRTVAIPDPLVVILKKHRQAFLEEKARRGITWTDDRVFRALNGSPVAPSTANRALETMCNKAGVPRLSFHSLRHTHATHLLELGVNPKVVQERLGHSNIGITLGVYSHVTREKHAETAALIGSVIG